MTNKFDFMRKKDCLNAALEVTKEFAKNGKYDEVPTVLEETYRKFKELMEDVNKQD